MLNPTELYRFVILPTLDYLGLQSPPAAALVLGTGLAESRLEHLSQIGSSLQEPGPGLGLFQMERATHDDIWQNYLAFRADLRAKVQLLCAATPEKHLQLVSNLAYSVAMCRLKYVRAAEALPVQSDNYEALARYWKQHYNTPAGKGTVQHFLESVEVLKKTLE